MTLLLQSQCDQEIEGSESALSGYSQLPVTARQVVQGRLESITQFFTVGYNLVLPLPHGHAISRNPFPVPPLPSNIAGSSLSFIKCTTIRTHASHALIPPYFQIPALPHLSFTPYSSSACTAGDIMRNAQGVVCACERPKLLLKPKYEQGTSRTNQMRY
jgi:hypothetical protein